MVGHKRSASDTLLPLRAPKQARTTTYHPLGGNSSPSQAEALPARWAKLGMEFFLVVRDTVLSMPMFRRGTDEDALPASEASTEEDLRERTSIPSPPPSPPPPPRASTSRQLPPRKAIPVFATNPITHHQATPLSTSAPAASNIHQRVQSHRNPITSQPTVILSKYASMQPNAVASTSKRTLTSPEAPKASESSIRTEIAQRYPEVGAALEDSTHRRRKSVKKYVEREHIHAKQHKARVQEEKKRTREEMEKDLQELYHIKRSAGFNSDFDSFRSLLSYQARLEKLDKTGALSPSPSLVDLRAKARQDEFRRHSFPDHVDPDFLQRAIQKAQDALKGPKPPKPFVPTLDQLRLSRLAQDEEIEERLRPKRKPLPASLPPADEAAVDALFRRSGVISKIAREQVSQEDVVRLQPCQWLNDEVINFYGQLILTRAEESKENPGAGGGAGRKKPLNAHYFSTFFWSKLKGQGYQKARMSKWTKKIDIFSKDVVLIPVNHNNAHWTAAAINFRKKRIESYDSMNMDRGQVFKLLRQYLDDEHRDKKKKPFDFTGWQDYTLPDTPQQENGYDCGVFTCQFLEALSRGEESFPFTQANMKYLRRKMVWEIGHAKLRDDS
ncbi:hypothetical protein VTO73DRAFT_1353 [Trametes versicolor]